MEEAYGLVFVYMGPPELKPPLPRYDSLEPLGEGESHHTGAEVIGLEQDYNWLQLFENAVDPVHAVWLHSNHSEFQFQGTGTTGFPEHYYDHRTDNGVKYIWRYQDAKGEGGAPVDLEWSVEWMLPNIIALPDFIRSTLDVRNDMLIWVVPADDTHHRLVFSIRSADPERATSFMFGTKQNGKDGWLLNEGEAALPRGLRGPVVARPHHPALRRDTGAVRQGRRHALAHAAHDAGRRRGRTHPARRRHPRRAGPPCRGRPRHPVAGAHGDGPGVCAHGGRGVTEV